MSEVERQVEFSSEKKTKIRTTRVPTIFRKCHARILCKSNSRFNSTHTVNNCGCGFLFFLSFVRVTWEKVVKSNCGCVIALTQSTIVAVSHSGLLFFLSFVRVTWKKAVKKAAKEFETHVISYGLGNVCHKGTLINFYLKKF